MYRGTSYNRHVRATKSWGQFNKTFTRVFTSAAIVLESVNNSYTCTLHE